MASFFKKGKAKTSGSSDIKKQRAAPTTPAKLHADAVFQGDDELLQLHEETAELLRFVKTPAKKLVKSPSAFITRQKGKPTGSASHSTPLVASLTALSGNARMTIEVLDEDDEDAEKDDSKVSGATHASPAEPRMQSNPALKDGSDTLFTFDAEEARVRHATDTFYPDTSPSKKAMDTQVRALTQEQVRLQRIDQRDQMQLISKQKELAHHQQHKLQNRLDANATKIQARARGLLCREKLKQQQQSRPSPPAKDEIQEWHEVRDVERGEVWYYNVRTGQSQWDPPPNFPVITMVSAAFTRSSNSAELLPSIKGSNGSFRMTLGLSERTNLTTGDRGVDLPPLSPSTSSACSSARSHSSEYEQSRPSSSKVQRTDPLNGHSTLSPKPTRALGHGSSSSSHRVGLPMLSPQADASAMSNPNPWECDSVACSSDDNNSLYSERMRGDEDEDEDEDENADFSRGRKSSMNDGECRDADPDAAGDWQINETLFLADGSRNSKLRDTIRNALYISKFDSISSLIASNVVLRHKTKSKKSRSKAPDDDDDPNAALSPIKLAGVGNNQRRSSNNATRGRDIVLGKREAPMFVAMLADANNAKQPPKQLRAKDLTVTASPKLKGKGTTKAMASRHPPRIRDVVDPGFHEDLGGSGGSPKKVSPKKHGVGDADDQGDDTNSDGSDAAKSVAVCFNCWSSSNGRGCELHRDPYEANRKVKAAESALMCTNWELDQLRRKHRAEEIQEVFMKQNASLRYDKRLKQYVTVVECKHPIYRIVNQSIASWNKTMRRKLHTRAWFRSFMEQLRAGRVPKADASTPGLLKLKNTIQNNRWCTKYSDSVREFHPVAPVTLKKQQPLPRIPDVIMIDPATPQMRNWVLMTEYTKPVELYRLRVYELPPKRCVPMPSPSFLDDIPLPVPNQFIDSGHIAGWLERLCARISAAAMHKALLQIHACSPPPGFNEARRTKVVTPITVVFATFGRKPTPGNLAVGGLSAELAIHMLVTTHIPAQFGNFIVFDRRAIAPAATKDYDAVFVCLGIAPATPEYVFRSLEHALNVRRPPCIIVATRSYGSETDEHALESKRFPFNRPEQTGEEAAHGFRTFWLVDAFDVPDEVASVLVQPNSDVLSPNTPSMTPTMTTKVDRTYPFCIPTTKENTPIEFIHLLWIGQSSRNQPQVFTMLGAQQPGEFMKNSNLDGALGVCTSTIYRSWAFMQSSPFEEFTTDDGVAYWYNKHSGETFWTRPIMPEEKYRGKDGDIDGVIADGAGEVATLGVGVDDARYPQQIVRKYMAKSVETAEEKEKRVRQVTASAKKYDIVIDLSEQNDHGNSGLTNKKQGLERIQVPQLTFQKSRERERDKAKATNNSGNGSRTQSPVKHMQQSAGSSSHEDPGAGVAFSGAQTLDSNTKQLIDTITQALGAAQGSAMMAHGPVDMLQLGIGLGMGLGLRAQQQQHATTSSSPVYNRRLSASASARSDRSKRRDSQSTHGLASIDLHPHDEHDGNDENENDDDMSTFRSDDSSESNALSARSTVSTATSVGDNNFSPAPDEMELLSSAADTSPHAGKKTPGYRTHPPPGEGSSWINKPIDASAESQTAVQGFGGAVHQRVACLPKDFVAAVTSTKTCKMQANYLPIITNTNQPRSVGVVKPRAALKEWIVVGYSPWSAGRAVFGTQFIEDLMQRPELLNSNNNSSTGGTASSLSAMSGGAQMVEQREKVTQAMKESQQLEAIFSHCRHGKYDDVEVMLNSPDWTLPIDSKDIMGNTLLSIACQNNNKRIAKLCMRRGADINTQNLNGQTVLHYCHEYGFHDLMDYLMEKSAKDDILNADGLTCYEGLNKETVDAL
uniref:WW domain-containing protein n=1 Tax=Globisporangium ultimum (strain ATCC 200006 / CBS 805.95 / DAOM BR144) TaxID=431595 RepID=K3WBG7_GLOUD